MDWPRLCLLSMMPTRPLTRKTERPKLHSIACKREPTGAVGHTTSDQSLITESRLRSCYSRFSSWRKASERIRITLRAGVRLEFSLPPMDVANQMCTIGQARNLGYSGLQRRYPRRLEAFLGKPSPTMFRWVTIRRANTNNDITLCLSYSNESPPSPMIPHLNPIQ